MATTVGSGIGSYLSSASEATYGVALTPTRSLEYGSHNIRWKPKRVVGNGLAGGTLLQKAAQRVQTTSTVEGDVKTQMYYKGMGPWLGSLFGSLGATPAQQGGTTAYLQTHTLATNWNQSLTLQAGMPVQSGLIVPRNFSGVKTVKGVFECKMDELLQYTATVDGRSEDTAAGRSDTSCTWTTGGPVIGDTAITLHDIGCPVTGTGIPAGSYVMSPLVPGVSFTLSSSPTVPTPVNPATGTGGTLTVGTAYAAPSYAASNPVFSFRDATIKLGSYGSETVVEGIRACTVTIDRPMKVDNFYQDGTGLKQQQPLNGYTKITVDFESDYLSDSAFVAQFVSDTAQSFVWDFVSSTNAGTGYPFEFKLSIPNLSWEDGAPEVTGESIIQPKLALVGLLDSSAHLSGVQATYMSTDTTL